MALLAQRILDGLKPARFSRTRPPATEAIPDRIVFGTRAGHATSQQPPVRIFLGSERHQFRAERAFLWSIEQHRDPSRTYEIYLMRDLEGFSRGFWLTGFTNYRFAIPAFCQYKGRAIYNDADQVYLTDPALLFDQDMGEAGFLSINDRDTSVMLIDCERMAGVWNERDVRHQSRKRLEAIARAGQHWGHLDEGWNARDKEFDPKTSKLVHFTTLHTQPWRPFPSQLVYFPNPTGSLWPEIEADANAHHFLPFNSLRPSRHWQSVALYLSSKKAVYPSLEYLGPQPIDKPVNQLDISHLLEYVPDQDALWVLVRLLSACQQLTIRIREPWAHGHGQFKRSAAFWLEHLQLAQTMVPNTRWILRYKAAPLGAWKGFHGGPALAGSVVVLTHRKPGHDHQAKALGHALAERLDRSIKELRITSTEAGFVVSQLMLRRAPVSPLPDDAAIVVAGGWLPTRLARLYQRRYPYLRLVLSGRKAGPPPFESAALVQCQHFGLPSHPRRIETLLPLNAGHYPPTTDDSPWAQWRQSDLKVACLLGGDTASYRYTEPDIKVLARQLADAIKTSGQLLVVGSRRSGALVNALAKQLPKSALIYRWQAQDSQNPYALAIEQADRLFITGESESMIADAVNAGRRFHIFYPPKPPRRPLDRLANWIAQKAIAPNYNRRGSIRPQQGLQYLCARAIERNWVIPPRDLHGLHHRLIEMGMVAEDLDTPITEFVSPASLDETTKKLIEQLQLAPHKT